MQISLSKTWWTLVVLIAFLGCGEKVTVSAKVKQIDDTPLIETPKDVQNYFYTPIGKRDPFRPYYLDTQKVPVRQTNENAGPLEQLELEQLKLCAIITGLETPLAMIEDPSGKGYTITPGMQIGRNGGRVARISRDEVIVEEEYYNSEGKRIINKISMKLAKEAADR